MANRQPTQPDQDLLARLREACRPSSSRSAFGLPADEASDYVVETPKNVVKRGTLGSTINYSPKNA